MRTNQRFLFVDEDGDLIGTNDEGIANEYEAQGATVYDTEAGSRAIPNAPDIREPEDDDEDEEDEDLDDVSEDDDA
jgi:hypothetical protein